MSVPFGYTGSILRVDLSSGHFTTIATNDYANRFVGGRGVAAKIYWDEVSPEIKALDAENRLIFLTGPLAGVKGVAGSRWEICGKSPACYPEQFCNCNLGGRWGAQLKFAGYDGLIVQGKATKPVYLLIQDGSVEIKDASRLWGKGAIEVREILKNELGSSVSVVATGPAGENEVSFANLVADNDASGSSGFGAVMGSKRLKAIVVRGSSKISVADPEKYGQLTKYVRELKKGMQLPDIGLETVPNKMTKDYCYGCPGCYYRASFEAADGKRGKFMCGSGLFYQDLAHRYYGEWNEVPFKANKICDEYGLDISAVQPVLVWLLRCYETGILTDENTEIPLSKIGSLEFIETLAKIISFRKGFGDVLAQGTTRAADLVGKGAKDLLSGYIMKDRVLPHDPRVYIITSLLYAMEPRPTPSQFSEVMESVLRWLEWARKREQAFLSSEILRGIARRFWGSELAVDFSTYNGKALAAKKIQDREFVKDSLILCTFSWPITTVINSEDHIGDPTVESKLFSAVTGIDADKEEFYRIGERIVNLQRAILAREGHKGREGDTLPEYLHTRPIKRLLAPYNYDCLVPGKDGEVIYKTGAVVDREKFELLKGEYYQLRGWDVTSGLQTRKKLEELGLRDIVDDLEHRGLAV